MKRRTFLFVLAAAAGCLFLKPFSDGVEAQARAALSLTALVSPPVLRGDTNVDGLAASPRASPGREGGRLLSDGGREIPP